MTSTPIKVLQVLPYFPPHNGGLETVADEWGKWYVKSGYGEVLNLVFSVGQPKGVDNYVRDGCRIVVIPAFELIANFPFPKFWTCRFWTAFKLAKDFDPGIVLTHTRFFLSSFLGGVFVKLLGKIWCHVEHGSDYVRLSSGWKNVLAYAYDKTIGKWVLRSSDMVVSISSACERFVRTEFGVIDSRIIYRGIDTAVPAELPQFSVPEGKTVIGFVGRLVEWKNVHSLISAFISLPEDVKKDCILVIVGNGEEMERLKGISSASNIIFTGSVPFSEALAIQSQFDIHVHPPLPGGGLATTLIQAMQMGLPIVATPNEGSTDVISDGFNGVLVPTPSPSDIRSGLLRILEQRNEWPVFAERNSKIVNEKFDWSKNIALYHKWFIQFSPNA